MSTDDVGDDLDAMALQLIADLSARARREVAAALAETEDDPAEVLVRLATRRSPVTVR